MKLQRNWDHFPRSEATPESVKSAQRKAIFELFRDVAEYAKNNPNCRVAELLLDQPDDWGMVGVIMEDLPKSLVKT